MKASCIFVAILLLLSVSTAQAQTPRPQFVPGELLVKLKDGASTQQLNSLQNQVNAQVVRHFKSINVYQLKIPTTLAVDTAVSQLKQNPLVEYAQPNYLYYLDDTVPNDPGFGSLWGLHNTGQDGGVPDADIDAPEAWDITTGSDQVVIAVIDSGVDLDHPDLAANIWTNPGEIPGNGLDDDQNGFVDDVHGWDFSGNDNDPSPVGAACRGHGTHVAGTIGAVGNNNVGVSGVNWHVKIMPLKAFTIVLGSLCAGDTAALISAVEYYTMMHVRISSNSWGGLLPDLAMMQAIIASDSIFVAAAGNGSLDGIGDNNDKIPFYPAGYPLPNVIAVAATDRTDTRAVFSNFGRQSVDLGAPGVDILSTLPDNIYGTLSGTSMATPHVSGVAGLLLAQDPTLTNQEVIWRILHGTDFINLPVLSGGRLNAYKALQFGLTTPAVTLDLSPQSTTTVPPGGLFLWRINLTNHQANQNNVTVRLFLQFENSIALPIYQASGLIAANATLSDDVLSLMPIFFPSGTKFRLIAQAETATSFDEDSIAYTVGAATFNTGSPYRVYLPLIVAGSNTQPSTGGQGQPSTSQLYHFLLETDNRAGRIFGWPNNGTDPGLTGNPLSPTLK